MNEIKNIPVVDIVPNPENPRKKMNEDELDELAQSIKAVGLLQPITVRHKILQVDSIVEDCYEIVCGHRRFEACERAGLKEVPCIVRELTDDEAYEIMVTENLQRKDVDPFDEATAFEALKRRGYDVDALAEKFGKSRTYVFSRIKLSNLIYDFRKKYEAGDIDFSHCLILARLDRDFQQRILKDYYSGGYNDLSGKGVKALRYAIGNAGIALKDAIFDTSACADCPKNAGCASLFLDIDKAVCQDPVCYSGKFVDKVFPVFEEIRRRNPDFFILEDWNIRQTRNAGESALVAKLREAGFTFVKGEDWDYTEIEKGGRYDIDREGIAGFCFGYRGFIGPKKERDAVEKKPWKNDYRLEDMAKNRDKEMADIAAEFATERIDAMTDGELRKNGSINLMTVVKAVLHVIVEDCVGVSAHGIEGGKEGQEEAIDALSIEDLCDTVAKFAAHYTMDYGKDDRFARRLFPDQFKTDDKAVLDKFHDRCRNLWYNYDGVTDEMIEADLAERLKKQEGKK